MQLYELFIGDPHLFESLLCRFRAIFAIILIIIILIVANHINETQLQELQLLSLRRATDNAVHFTLLASSDQFQRSVTRLFILATNSFELLFDTTYLPDLFYQALSDQLTICGIRRVVCLYKPNQELVFFSAICATN